MKETLLSELSIDRVRDDVEAITQTIPTRLAGSPNSKRMAEYSAKAVKEAGVDAKIDEFLGLVSFTEHADVRVLSPQSISLKVNTLGYSVLAPKGGIRAQIVDTDSGDFSDFPEEHWGTERVV